MSSAAFFNHNGNRNRIELDVNNMYDVFYNLFILFQQMYNVIVEYTRYQFNKIKRKLLVFCSQSKPSFYDI